MIEVSQSFLSFILQVTPSVFALQNQQIPGEDGRILQFAISGNAISLVELWRRLANQIVAAPNSRA